jgi:hypothetical protein
VNQGNPAVLAQPNTDFAKAMTGLARTLVPAPRQTSSKRRKLSLSRS